ncbi:MAG TPA: hypothetical protein VFW33_03615 [Gemmataceae bacterium]|nr:hypothetical protein [Gemmataceae bacterium]
MKPAAPAARSSQRAETPQIPLDLSPLWKSVEKALLTLVEEAVCRVATMAPTAPAVAPRAETVAEAVEVIPVPALALNVDESAAFIGVSRRHFYSLVAAGLMPQPYYAGTMSSRWLVSELEAAFRKLPRRPRKVRRAG